MESLLLPQKKRIAVIGAGIAGISLCWKLRNSPFFNIFLYEKTKKISGRATSITINDKFICDTGANYFYSENNEILNIILNQIPCDELIDIKKPIYTFDEFEKITPGNELLNSKRKLTYKSGIAKLSELLFSQCKNCKVEFDKQINKIIQIHKDNHHSPSWKLITEKEELGPFDIVVLTPPAPIIYNILKLSEFLNQEDESIKNLIEEFSKISYRTIYSILLAYKAKIKEPYYALLNSDRKHSISWLSIENEKKGRIPEGYTVILTQMSDEYSRSQSASNDEEIINNAQLIVEGLLKLDKIVTNSFEWGKVIRWEYALPNKIISKSIADKVSKDQLYFAGDFLQGRGRVLESMEAGITIAEIIESKFASQKL